MATRTVDDCSEEGKGEARRGVDAALRQEAESAVMAVVAEMERTGEKVIKYEDARDALARSGYGESELDAAVQHGSLTLDADNLLSFGIPSFHSYMTLLLANECAGERRRANEGASLGR